MAYEIKKYRINRLRLERAFCDGFELTDEGALVSSGDGSVASVFFTALDGVTDSCPWGRFLFDATAGEDTVFTVKAIASDEPTVTYNERSVVMDSVLRDPATPLADKFALFEQAGNVYTSVYSDMLLHGLNGRYLWICLTTQGNEARFSNFRALTPGDRFLRTFPEVYRNTGAFFHRYISVFSSIYGDLEEEIDRVYELLDLDMCPAELLPVYASWFGITPDGDYMDEKRLRIFLKKAYSLIRKKGTREAIEELVGIFVDEPFYIVEHADVIGGSDRETKRALQRLYGDDPYSFTLLIKRKPDEKLQLRLMRLIEQFKPLRMNVRILFIEDKSALDSGANLDVNALLTNPKTGILDEGIALNGTDYLS
ncbi:MAG: phage tail protein [Clostridiales Family XIII bacterium]|nr:phage tail protein [Clostridiales Family XIII bacterium]